MKNIKALRDALAGVFSPCRQRTWSAFRSHGFTLVLLFFLGAAFSFTPPCAAAPFVFSTTGSLITARQNHTATLLPNGKILVAGGSDTNNDFFASAELFDPASGAWTQTGKLNFARSDQTATLLPSGLVLVVGGYDGDTIVPSAELYNPATGAWTITSGSPVTPRGWHTATLLPNGQVLVAGGYNGGAISAAELYDPATDTWASTASLANARFASTATLLQNGLVLVVGGFGASSALQSAELYNPANGSWISTGNLAAGRYAHTATSLPNGQVLVAGGADGSGDVLNSAELYNPASGGWTTVGHLSTARLDHSATLLPDGQVVVAGGQGSTNNILGSAELYNPTTLGWSVIAGGLATTRINHTATLIASGKVVFVGGQDGSAKTISAVELGDPAAGTWRSTGFLTASRSAHSATLLLGGQVLVTGGRDGNGNILASSELSNPGGGWTTTTGTLANARCSHTATLLPNGLVLVAGGINSTSLASAELFNPATGAWITTGSLSDARWGHTATLLSNGKVLVTGGSSGGKILASAELYDPASGAWTTTGHLISARLGHTATLLPSGLILVAGGTSATALLSSAELYNPANGAWTAIGSLAAPIENHTATLLPNGMVLVVGGRTSGGKSVASAQFYNSATGKWVATGSLAAARSSHKATLLPGGKLLVVGGSYSAALPVINSAELYDPATRLWTITGSPVTARQGQTATLLPSGETLITGGIGSGGILNSAELYNIGLGFSSPAWQAQIATATPLLVPGGSVVLTGSGFTGSSGGSCGTTHDASTNYPLVQLRALDGTRVEFLPPNPAVGWSGSSFSSIAVNGFPCGLAMVTVFANGIPSVSSLIVAGAGAPSSLAYAEGSAVYVVNLPVSDSPAGSGGAATFYSIAPALPAGLSLSASTGVITGLPTALSSATTYTVTASNVFGAIATMLSITVVGANPSAITGKASGITSVTGTLNGTVTPNGLDTTCYYRYGTTTACIGGTTAAYDVGNGAVKVAFGTVIGGLTGATTYHYQLVAANSSGTTSGAVQTFTTLIPPAPAKGTATGIGSGTAALSATVDGYGTSTAYLQYGTTTAYGSVTGSQSISGTGAHLLSGTLTELLPATRYHFRVVETTGSRTIDSADSTFVTAPIFPQTTVAARGGTQVGIPNVRFVSFGAPAINASGDVAFRAVIAGTGIKPAANSGIWVETGSGAPGPVVRTGTPTSFQSGSLSISGLFSALGDPLFNNSGEVAFLGTVKTVSGKNALVYEGIWTAGTTGGLVQVAQTKETVPDVSGSLTGAAIASFAQFVLTDQGDVAFLANLANGGDTTAANNLGAWMVDADGDWHFVARKGFPLTTATGSTAPVNALSIFAAPTGVGGQSRSFNANGELMFAATFKDATQGIFTMASNGVISSVWTSSDLAPGISGSQRFATFQSPIVNDGGDVAFQATISGIAANSAAGIWAESGTAGALSLVARLGIAASYTNTDSIVESGVFTELGTPVFNANDQAAFIGTIKSGSGRSVTSDQGIWITGTSSDDLLLVTKSQDSAPDCAKGAKFSSFSQLVLPNQGGVVFVANLVMGAGGVTAATNQGIWVADASGQLSLVARNGDVFLIAGAGDTTMAKTIGALSIFTGSVGTGGQTRSFCDDGAQVDLVYKVTFTDGTESIYKVFLN